MSKRNKKIDFDLLRTYMMGGASFSGYDISSQTQTIQREVDLHLSEKSSDVNFQNNMEKLSYQLDKCKKAIDTAVLNNQTELYLIHGIGKGRLKKEIHRILSIDSRVKKFKNEYHVKYGYGATKVEFV